MDIFRKKTGEKRAPSRSGVEMSGDYPESIQKMSEEWRSIQKGGEFEKQQGFFERNFLYVGILIGMLIIALIIVIGGFSFLVWNAG